MMTPDELKARAERAAEWLKTKNYNVRELNHDNERRQWQAEELSAGDKFCRQSMVGSDKILIAFCEDRGWRDPIPTEAEALYYLVKTVGWYVRNDQRDWFMMEHHKQGEGWKPINPVEEALKLGYEGEG